MNQAAKSALFCLCQLDLDMDLLPREDVCAPLKHKPDQKIKEVRYGCRATVVEKIWCLTSGVWVLLLLAPDSIFFANAF